MPVGLTKKTHPLDATKKDIKRLTIETETDVGNSRLNRELSSALDSYLGGWEKRSLESSIKARRDFTYPKDYTEFKNTPIKSLIEDNYFLGLKDEMFPVHKEELILTADLWLKGELEEVVDISAMGVGKTFKMAAFIWLVLYFMIIEKHPPRVFGLDPKTKLGIAVMSKTGNLAKEVTFMQLLPFFDCGFFNDYFPPQINIAKVENTRKYPKLLRFPKRIAVFPGTGGSSEVVRGHNLIAAVLDEFAWMERIVKSRRNTFGLGEYDAAQEIYTTISNRMFTRAPGSKRRPLIMMISSPRSKWDFAEEKYQQGLRSKHAPENKELVEEITDEKLNITETGVIINDDGTIDLEGLKKGLGRKVVSLRRKPLWKGRPAKWKDVTNWTGKYMLFDTQELVFINNKVEDGLFDDDNDLDSNGFLKVPIEAAKYFVDSPEAACRDIGAVASGGINRFFKRVNKLHLVKDQPNYLHFSNYDFFLDKDYHPDNLENGKEPRFLHVDIAYSDQGDCAGFACSAVSDWVKMEGRSGLLPVVSFDFMQELTPAPGGHLRISRIQEIIIEMQNRGFNIGLVTYDGFQSVSQIQDLWELHNIPSGTLSIDNTTHAVILFERLKHVRTADDFKRRMLLTGTSAMYGTVKYALGQNNQLAPWFEFRDGMYTERVRLPGYYTSRFNILIEMEQEEYYPHENKVDHPPKGKHDGLQAVVGAYFNTINNAIPSSSPYEYEEEADPSLEFEAAIESMSEEDFKKFLHNEKSVFGVPEGSKLVRRDIS